MAAGTVTIKYQDPRGVASVRMYNDTGAALSQYEPTVIGERFAVAAEAIANTAKGAFEIGAMVLESSNLKAAENTFGTKNASVYFDPTSLQFSDTETAGYYKIGQVDEVKDSGGVIRILAAEIAVLIGT